MIRKHNAALLTAVQAKQRSKDTPKSDKVPPTEAQIRLFWFFPSSLEKGTGSCLAWNETSESSWSCGVITRKTIVASRDTHKTWDDLVLEMTVRKYTLRRYSF